MPHIGMMLYKIKEFLTITVPLFLVPGEHAPGYSLQIEILYEYTSQVELSKNV